MMHFYLNLINEGIASCSCKLGIHSSTALFHLDQLPVFFPPTKSIDLGGHSRMLQRALSAASIPPTSPPARLTPPHTERFRFLERAPSPPRPEFSSLTPTHIPAPQRSPHTQG
ncbi:hypothetical protein AVEN_73049-1 [Araneus ventricosus]|uniref:Uncharacterized protein n=1 Tax=Araneus ventricosus TaxID=182803 RepID=A0A4Y2FDU2_ARAVE|nr:hypothetical protein AVEN_73049-1 [Araneus ventricosus]